MGEQRCVRHCFGMDREIAEIVRTREFLGLVGIEHFGVKVNDLADALGKSRDGVSKWMRRGEMRRETDREFAAAAEDLDLHAGKEP